MHTMDIHLPEENPLATRMNRELQRQLLEQLDECYPETLYGELFKERDEREVIAQLHYLTEHGLVDTKFQAMMSGDIMAYPAKITAKGRDFLADDGGLTALLGVVTIKLHEDSIKALIIDRVEKSDASTTMKSEMVKQVRSLPAEAMKTLTTKLLEAGLRHLPNGMDLLHSLLMNHHG
ncbi:hypothetical protein [Dyella sp. Tek66A03]|uniref:hypothetical protein n=1 Tax=Dyella sp. Tek66A03 TaxID=3458298 RepID=UPI00403EC8D6